MILHKEETSLGSKGSDRAVSGDKSDKTVLQYNKMALRLRSKVSLAGVISKQTRDVRQQIVVSYLERASKTICTKELRKQLSQSSASHKN